MKKIVLFLGCLILPYLVVAQASLVSVSPDSAYAFKVLDVTITGNNTHFNTSNGTVVKFGFDQGTGTTIINKTTIVDASTIITNITVPSRGTGAYDVTVNNTTDGSITLPNAFTIVSAPPRSLVSVSPSTANIGQTLTITFRGQNTSFSSAFTPDAFIELKGAGVFFNTIHPNSMNILNDTLMEATFTIPSKTFTGDYNIAVSNSTDGNQYILKGFHVNGIPAPELISVSPSSSNAGKVLTVTITGNNTHFKPNGTNVIFGFNQATGTNIVNFSTVISESVVEANITIPATQPTGSYNVFVEDSIDGVVRLDSAFHITGVPLPELTSISPSGANAGDTMEVTIQGKNTHFASGTNTIYFKYNSVSSGIYAYSITPVSETSLKAIIIIPPLTKTRVYTVEVTNTIDGTLKLYSNFSVNGIPTPYLSTVTPSAATAGQTLDVTISGVSTHFQQAGSNSVSFSFNQGSSTISTNSITALNDSSLKVNLTIPQHAPIGNYGVIVENSIDGKLEQNNLFHVIKKCHAFYKTAYDPANNTFTLTLDSLTSLETFFYWDFGDGTTSTDKLPEHTFTSDTLYNVCLKIITSAGDTCNYCHIIGKDSLGNPVTKVKGFSTKVVPFTPIFTEITEEPVTEVRVQIFPNPAGELLNVATRNIVNPNDYPVLSIYSVEGKLLLQQLLVNDFIQLNIHGLAGGMYILELESNEHVRRLKFIKQQ